MDETAVPAEEQWKRWGVRVLRFPLTRIVLFGTGIAAAAVIQAIPAAGLSLWLESTWLRTVVGVVFPILAVHFAYLGMTRLLERRSAAELSLRGALGETSAGALVGAACLTLIVALIAALGFYQVQGVGAWTALLTAFAIAATSGYVEEVIFRGVVFRILEEGLGTWLALAISAALFGFVHLSNPNATFYGAAAIAIEAGVLLGAAYVLTRRLWLAIGIHFGWNFMVAGVFGPNLSGIQVRSVLESRLSGPDFLSGGALGVEGSVFAIALGLLVSAALLRRARLQDRFIRPFWRREATLPPPTGEPTDS